MSVILVFLLVIFCVAGWWLANQRIMSKPWLEGGVVGALPDNDVTHMPTAKVGLGVLLAVIGGLFALFASAYFMRMEYADWQAPPMPAVLWLNTGILALASVALHCAVVAARGGRMDTTRLALAAAAIASLVFLAGQLVAWRELAAEGHNLRVNAANGFFYLITGMHGLHIIGGLVGLGWTVRQVWRSQTITARLRLGVELCAMYWHVLFVIWLGLFVLLAGWASNLVAACRQLLM
ncbi:cytochrome c oxidase subunit 3 [Mesorhizobium xinjiangense]|uniref:cytochrome c oxidase subunit 3 n=1 Tax=Mesorhizobium xinjiangense TaxID=2678685 RepID=UPI0012EE5D5C|nr:cytochrome c oxidase subunit 3 [Mesorhizobium xinjiangense]